MTEIRQLHWKAISAAGSMHVRFVSACWLKTLCARVSAGVCLAHMQQPRVEVGTCDSHDSNTRTLSATAGAVSTSCVCALCRCKHAISLTTAWLWTYYVKTPTTCFSSDSVRQFMPHCCGHKAAYAIAGDGGGLIAASI